MKNQKQKRKLINNKQIAQSNRQHNHVNIPNKQSQLLKQFNIKQAFQFQMIPNNPISDIDDEIKQIFTVMNQKNINNKQKNKQIKNNFIFKPKSTLKINTTKQSNNNHNTIKQQYDNKRKQGWEMWKLKKDLIKVFNINEKQLNKNEKQQQIKSKQYQQQQLQKSQNKQQSSSQQNDKIRKAKTTQKRKKIKKQTNYIKTDLKRKYKDRFLGTINKNLKMLTKNGRIKRKFAKNQLIAQLQMDQGSLYNSYVISLSKALFVTLNIDDDQVSSQQQQLHYQIPTIYTKQNLQKLILDLFKFTSFREGQYQVIKNILQGKSTLFISQTASGKSLTYLLSSIILKGLSIVISPLVSLMLDQLNHLPSDLPAACISSLLNNQQKNRIINMIKQGKIQLLYITPQSFLTDFMYHVTQFPAINFICIDEAHSLSQLSHSFRSAYLSLQQIILTYFTYKSAHPVLLCLTATANIQTIQSIAQKLKIKQIIRSKTIINKNLFITISRECLHNKYQGVILYLNNQFVKKCKGVMVYCRTKKIMYEVFHFIRNSGAMCYIYHSGLPQHQKVQTIQKFRNGQIRIIISTIALGMGLDFQNLQCIIHINMPKSIENYIQEIGRAGRRSRRAYCHLFLDKFDYFKERNYFLADQLDQANFNMIVNIMKEQGIKKSKSCKKLNLPNGDEEVVDKLKRFSIEQNLQDVNRFDEDEIYYEQQDNIKQDQINEKKDKQQKQLNQYAVENNENKQNQVNRQLCKQFKPFSHCKSAILTQKSGLKQQAILNILLKIQKILGKQTIKVLPMSYQMLKISFFKKNEQAIKKQSQFYPKLIKNCKIVKGTIYIPLIIKCNQLKIPPIMLLSQVYGLSYKYTLKIQLVNQVFVWQHIINDKHTFDQLSNKNICKNIIEQFNIVQKTSLTKFNIFYSLCFDASSKSINHILKNRQIIPETAPLPLNSIVNRFDEYFKQQTYEYYKEIAKEAEVANSSNIQKDGNIEAGYLPISDISEEDAIQIKQSVVVFIRHILSINPQKSFILSLAPYRDGRIIAKVFLGVNDSNSNWKTYGEHEYWMKFVEKDYKKLLKYVKKFIIEFIEEQGPHLLAIQREKGIKSIKKS